MKLWLTLLIVFISGCAEKTTPQEQSSLNKAEAKRSADFWLNESNSTDVCIDGVVYIFFESDRRASMTVKFNINNRVVTCVK